MSDFVQPNDPIEMEKAREASWLCREFQHYKLDVRAKQDIIKYLVNSFMLKKKQAIALAMVPMITLSACSSLPQLYQAAEEIADDTAIDVSISKEALNKDTNIHLDLKVDNTPKD